MGVARRTLLKIWKQTSKQARDIYRKRLHVEGTFSNLVCHAGCLGSLPPFVHWLERPQRWVGAKILFYHPRLEFKLNANT